MKTNILHVLNLTTFLVSFGCASSAIRVESNPEGADVLVAVQGQGPKKIGTTPLNLTENIVNPGKEPFQITVVKEGFQSESVLVPSTSFSRSTLVNVKLSEIPTSSKTMNDQTLQKLASAVASAQAMIISKEYTLAEQTILANIGQYPGVSTLHELLGNVYYLQKDLSRALSSYRRAYSINPNNSDTQRMIKKIEDIEGARGSSSGGVR